MTDELHGAWNVTTDAWEQRSMSRRASVLNRNNKQVSNNMLCQQPVQPLFLHVKQSLNTFLQETLFRSHNLGICYSLPNTTLDIWCLFTRSFTLWHEVSAHEYFAVIHNKCQNGHLGSTSQLLVAIKARLYGTWGGVKTITLICSNSFFCHQITGCELSPSFPAPVMWGLNMWQTSCCSLHRHIPKTNTDQWH